MGVVVHTKHFTSFENKMSGVLRSGRIYGHHSAGKACGHACVRACVRAFVRATCCLMGQHVFWVP